MMWLKKLLLKWTKKALTKIDTIDYGKNDSEVTKAIKTATDSLDTVLKNWDKVEQK